MSKVTSLGAETGLTVLDSNAEMSAAAKSWAVTGVVTWELILLSRHHLTRRQTEEVRSSQEGCKILHTIQSRHIWRE